VIKDDTSRDEFLTKEGYRVAHFSLKHEFSRNERSVSDDVGDSHLKLGRETGLELGEFFLGLRFGEPIVPP
jgi:hypothetical protein